MAGSRREVGELMRAAVDTASPDEQDAQLARDALVRVQRYLEEHPGSPHQAVELTAEEADAQQLTLPRSVIEVMAFILTHMAAGHSVSVVPHHADLTTQQAADLLNVSRPHLVGLLDAGEIEHHMVGTHRRVAAASVLDYKRRDDARRRGIADELTALSQELGLD
jgi:excisionase family DNA binding protein